MPYADGHVCGFLPAYRLKPLRPKCTIVFFGGFDSYVEEVTPAFVFLRNAGYDVIAFDGPGQGGALDDERLPMTADWHNPIGTILDHFEVQGVALAGLSLGACLALRAAALEPRVARVVAYDVLTNFFDATLRQTRPQLRGLLKVLLKLRVAKVVNWMIAKVARKSLVVDWGIRQGMHVTGTTSAFDFLQRTRQFQTADISASIGQDFLLMAGNEDHYVPVQQWNDQIRMLTNARSITARLFTRNECAQNHCQVGNYGLALRTIVDWLDRSLLEIAGVCAPSVEHEPPLPDGAPSSAQVDARACHEQ